MLKKHKLFFTISTIIILIIVGVVYFKMKHDEHQIQQEKIKQQYYQRQQERITIFLKYNSKEPNAIKSVHFTTLKQNPMGDTVIEGYINDKETTFVAYGSPQDNFEFTSEIMGSEKFDKLLKNINQRKSTDEIKNEEEYNGAGT